MKIGLNGTGLVQRADVARICDHAAAAASDGFTSYWLAEHPTGGLDALSVLLAVGQRVPHIELGTAIVPTFPRHPMVLAGQTLTTAGVIDHRLTLGIGLSHEPMMAQLGIGFDKPVRHLREYLSILMPLLHDGRVDFQGETLSARVELFQPPKQPTAVVVAALGPQALSVAGRLSDGTTLAWVGPKTVREHIVPRLVEAAGVAHARACEERRATEGDRTAQALLLAGLIVQPMAVLHGHANTGRSDRVVQRHKRELRGGLAAEERECNSTQSDTTEHCLH